MASILAKRGFLMDLDEHHLGFAAQDSKGVP